MFRRFIQSRLLVWLASSTDPAAVVDPVRLVCGDTVGRDTRGTIPSELLLWISPVTSRLGEIAVILKVSSFGSGSGGIGLSGLREARTSGSGRLVAMVDDSNWRAFLVFFFLGLIQTRVFIDPQQEDFEWSVPTKDSCNDCDC